MTRPQSFLSTVPRKSVIIFLAGVFLLFITSGFTGGIFLILTDGILEVPNKQNAEFGLSAVKKILTQNSARPLTEIATAVIKATDLPWSRRCRPLVVTCKTG